jgi:hypothetical protein
MNGSIVGACNCDWGCPCNFDVAPTDGRCDGVYVWSVDEGHHGDVDLAGLKFSWAAHSEGPMHEGNVTSVLIVDEGATSEQREAVQTLWKDSSGPPFEIFRAITATWLEPITAPIEFDAAGINSKVRIGGGEIYELALARVKNPVTGSEEELYLDKPTGFTSTRSELGMSTVARFSSEGLSYDNSGKYAEYSEFAYGAAA